MLGNFSILLTQHTLIPHWSNLNQSYRITYALCLGLTPTRQCVFMCFQYSSLLISNQFYSFTQLYYIEVNVSMLYFLFYFNLVLTWKNLQ